VGKLHNSQPAGSTGSHAYGHVADYKESQIQMILEYPRFINMPKTLMSRNQIKKIL
jgi:hypothetical protein